MSGLPLESVEQALDFPYSSGYLYTGEIADNGVLVGLETVLNEETVLGETELLAGQNAVSMTVDVPAGEKIEFRIWKPGDGITAVEKFEFERLTADEI